MKTFNLILSLLCFSSCLGGQAINSHTFDNVLGASGCADPSDTNLCAAMVIIERDCVSCHTSAIHNVWGSYDTNEKWIASGNVIAGEPNLSPLIYRLQNMGSDMPVGMPKLEDEDYQVLRKWIENM